MMRILSNGNSSRKHQPVSSPSVLVFPSLPAMAEWLFGTAFLRNQPRHRSVTKEEARGAAACQQERLRATLMAAVRKEEEHEGNTGNKSRDE